MQGGGAGQRGFSHATFARENKERSAAWRRGNTRIHLDGGRQPAGWYGRGRLADLPSFFPEGLQGNLAADFVGAQRNPPERKPGQRSVEKEVSKLATLQAVFFGANRTMTFGKQFVDHDVANGEHQAVGLFYDGDGLTQAHDFGQHDGNKTAAGRILENGFHLFYRDGQFIEKSVELVAFAGAGKGPLHVAVFGQESFKHGQPFPEKLGHGEQAQGVAAGSGIDHDAVVDALLDPRGYFEESHEFIEAGERKIEEAVDFLVVEKGSARRDLPQFGAVFLLEIEQVFLRVEFKDFQISGGNEAGETVGERVRGVGRDQQERRLRRTRGQAQRRGRGASSFSAAAFAAEDEELQAGRGQKTWHSRVTRASRVPLHCPSLPSFDRRAAIRFACRACVSCPAAPAVSSLPRQTPLRSVSPFPAACRAR